MAASLTFVVYEHLLSLNDEYTLIWRSKWNLAKIVYLVLRFYSMGFIASNVYVRSRADWSEEFCNRYRWWSIVGVALVTNVTTNILMCLRLHAIYERRKRVLVLLLVLFWGSLAAELYCEIQYSLNDIKVPVLPNPIPGCVPSAIPPGFPSITAWVPTVVVQGIFFLMAFYHLISSMTHEEKKWRSILKLRAKSTTPFLLLFFKDGAFFFFIILVALIVGLVIMLHDTPLTSLAISWVIAIYSFAGTRIILDLRKRAMQNVISGTNGSWRGTFDQSTNGGRETGNIVFANRSTVGTSFTEN
ncbi:hypothetical protein K435DRAFT_781709, partial [Dendrothele bispora CBS 962.96]